MRLENFLGAYQAGNSLMHRAPVWAKYLLMLVLGVVPFFLHSIALSVACLVISGIVMVGAARRPLSELNPSIAILVMCVLVFIYDYFFVTWQAGVIFVSGLISCLWLARILTTTTPASVLMDALASLAKPFRFMGAKPEKFALTIAIMWNSIPYLMVSIRNVRDAARARGLERFSWRYIAPIVVSAVGHALQVGEALQARGLADVE